MKTREIQNIIKDFESSSLMFLELEMNGFKLKLSKSTQEENKTIEEKSKTVGIPNIKENAAELIRDNTTKISSPLVGTYYEATSPSAKPFVQVGDKVEKGQVVCIIEAMKIMNEITAPESGVVSEILVSNGDVVGFDQVLMKLGKHHEE